MESVARSFGFSETSIAERKQLTIAVLLAMLVMFAPLVATSSGFVLIVFAVIIGVTLTIAVLQSWWMFRQLRRMRLIVEHDALIRESGASREVVSWSSINRVRAHESPGGTLRSVTIDSSGRRPVVLAGFEDLPQILALIAERIAPTAVETRRSRIDWASPIVLFSSMVITGLAVEALLLLGGSSVTRNFNLVTLIGLGLLWIVYAPISRQSPAFRRYELVLGWAFLALGVFTLLLRW